VNPAVQECFVELGGGRLRYLRAGTGPPLVLLHGLLGYSFSWRFTMPALAPYATVYAPDMLGAGFSDYPPAMDYTMPAHARRLLLFAEVLGLESFDLLGTSHGGAVAMFAAALSRKSRVRVRRLILSGPVNPWSTHGRRLAPLMGTPLGSFVFKHTMGRMRFLQQFWLRRLYGDASRIPPGTLEGYRAPYRDLERFNYGLQIVRTWNADLRALETIMPDIADSPALLLWGTRDVAVSYASAVPLRQVFRHCRVVAWEGVGHLPYEEVPEPFNRELISFLSLKL
jgi:pimeloyl-ACP methyl ester carboxylesterase